MTLPELDSTRLYVFVCGPGQGESIAIRVPPDRWIVIDSCRSGGQVFAKAVLKKYGGHKDCLVLTHRHRDHYRGFSDLAEMPEWRLIACNDRSLVDAIASSDPAAKLKSELGHVFAIIRQRWLKSDGSEWATWRGSNQLVGDAELICLHPDETFAKAFEIRKCEDENLLSSAMVLRWQGHLILLGADTPNPEWESIKTHFENEFDPGNHLFAKIPHHGSRGSLSDSALSGLTEQVWSLTPYNSSDLPKYDPGEGLEYLMGRNSLMHMTGLPVGKSSQPTSPCRTTLEQLRTGGQPKPDPFVLNGLTGVDVTPSKDELKNYFVFAFANDGRHEVVVGGNGTVIVEQPKTTAAKGTSIV